MKIQKEKSIKKLSKNDHIALAVWAADCADHVLHYFEEEYPEDKRPRKAIEILRKWIRTGIFSMAEIRKASLDSHAAARKAGEDSAARSAARAAGQAVATAHVPTHVLGVAYTLQAVYRATTSEDAVKKELNWQWQHLPANLRPFVKARSSIYKKKFSHFSAGSLHPYVSRYSQCEI